MEWGGGWPWVMGVVVSGSITLWAECSGTALRWYGASRGGSLVAETATAV